MKSYNKGLGEGVATMREDSFLGRVILFFPTGRLLVGWFVMVCKYFQVGAQVRYVGTTSQMVVVSQLCGGLPVFGDGPSFSFGLEFVPRNYDVDKRHIQEMGLQRIGIPTWRKVAVCDSKKLPGTKTHQ